ncbi:outer membrane protein assembly factor BamB family protein [Natrinema ejinorense]|uniref:Pyrrolo-quinoline quinone n=1 Tax=Natrinema ejinorense TaxID=373386 RepID=A0A2A5QWQ4_9EURY|nr:PQQ-binding-like beta-propeller repeat protein [Natrinema ejinorense]PCR91213.1 pyrrolo-quinoline quinone [Natrinema ejinorense]
MPSRRDVLFGIGAVGTAAVAGCLGGPSADPGSLESYTWTTSGADRRNSRAIPDGTAPRDEPTVDWRVEFGSPVATDEPIVTDDTVLVAVGTDVVAFDRETADRRWSIDPENDAYMYRSSPTVFDGTAYVPEVTSLTARDLETGEIDWSHEFDTTIGQGSLLVSDGGENGRVFAAGGNYVHALDAETGDHLWEQELFGTARYSLAKYTDYLYVATSGGELYAITRWGAVEWRRTVEAGITSAPIALSSSDGDAGPGVAVAGGDGSITYFGMGGAREWQTELGGFGDDGLAIAHRTLLARSGSTLHALDPNDGSGRWRVDLGRGSNNPPIVVGDTVYLGGDKLRAIDIDGGIGIRSLRVGEQRFEHDEDDAVSFVTAADGKLFATTNVERFGDESAELVVLS